MEEIKKRPLVETDNTRYVQILSTPKPVLELDDETYSKQLLQAYVSEKEKRIVGDEEMEGIRMDRYGKDASYSSAVKSLKNQFSIKEIDGYKPISLYNSKDEVTVGDFLRNFSGNAAKGKWGTISGMTRMIAGSANLQADYFDFVGNKDKADGLRVAAQKLNSYAEFSDKLGIEEYEAMTGDSFFKTALTERDKNEFWSSGLGQMSFQILGGLATGGIATPFTSSGQLFDEAYQEGKKNNLSDSDASKKAYIYTAAFAPLETASELLTLGILKPFKPFIKNIGSKGLRTAARIGVNSALDAAVEGVSESSEYAGLNTLMGKDVDPVEFWYNFRAGALLGVVMSGVFSGKAEIDMRQKRKAFIEQTSPIVGRDVAEQHVDAILEAETDKQHSEAISAMLSSFVETSVDAALQERSVVGLDEQSNEDAILSAETGENFSQTESDSPLKGIEIPARPLETYDFKVLGEQMPTDKDVDFNFGKTDAELLDPFKKAIRGDTSAQADVNKHLIAKQMKDREGAVEHAVEPVQEAPAAPTAEAKTAETVEPAQDTIDDEQPIPEFDNVFDGGNQKSEEQQKTGKDIPFNDDVFGGSVPLSDLRVETVGPTGVKSVGYEEMESQIRKDGTMNKWQELIKKDRLTTNEQHAIKMVVSFKKNQLKQLNSLPYLTLSQKAKMELISKQIDALTSAYLRSTSQAGASLREAQEQGRDVILDANKVREQNNAEPVTAEEKATLLAINDAISVNEQELVDTYQKDKQNRKEQTAEDFDSFSEDDEKVENPRTFEEIRQSLIDALAINNPVSKPVRKAILELARHYADNGFKTTEIIPKIEAEFKDSGLNEETIIESIAGQASKKKKKKSGEVIIGEIISASKKLKEINDILSGKQAELKQPELKQSTEEGFAWITELTDRLKFIREAKLPQVLNLKDQIGLRQRIDIAENSLNEIKRVLNKSGNKEDIRNELKDRLTSLSSALGIQDKILDMLAQMETGAYKTDISFKPERDVSPEEAKWKAILKVVNDAYTSEIDKSNAEINAAEKESEEYQAKERRIDELNKQISELNKKSLEEYHPVLSAPEIISSRNMAASEAIRQLQQQVNALEANQSLRYQIESGHLFSKIRSKTTPNPETVRLLAENKVLRERINHIIYNGLEKDGYKKTIEFLNFFKKSKMTMDMSITLFQLGSLLYSSPSTLWQATKEGGKTIAENYANLGKDNPIAMAEAILRQTPYFKEWVDLGGVNILDGYDVLLNETKIDGREKSKLDKVIFDPFGNSAAIGLMTARVNLFAKAMDSGLFVTKESQQALISAIEKSTGRGRLPKGLEAGGSFMNLLFSSVRVMSSVLEYPILSITHGDPATRAFILKKQGKELTGIVMLYMLASALFGRDKVDLDPTSNTFLRINVGDKWVNPLGMYIFPIRTSLRIVYKLGTDAVIAMEDYGIDTGFDIPDRYRFNPKDEFSTFINNRSAPWIALANGLITGETWLGEETPRWKIALSGITPISAEQTIESIFNTDSDPATGLLWSTFGFFGGSYFEKGNKKKKRTPRY